jgi:hypothetical protein
VKITSPFHELFTSHEHRKKKKKGSKRERKEKLVPLGKA